MGGDVPQPGVWEGLGHHGWLVTVAQGSWESRTRGPPEPALWGAGPGLFSEIAEYTSHLSTSHNPHNLHWENSLSISSVPPLSCVLVPVLQ